MSKSLKSHPINRLIKNYLGLAAVVLGLFSLLLIAAPNFLMRKLDITHSPTGTLFMQFLGASLAGHSYLNWRARHFDPTILKLVYKMNMVALSLAVVISLVAVFATAYNKLCLLILLMHGLFLAGFIVITKRMPPDDKA